LLARPSTINASTILPHSQTPVLITNQIGKQNIFQAMFSPTFSYFAAPIIPKAVPTNPPPGFTTYLVFDGNQGQVSLKIHLSYWKILFLF